MKRISYIMVVCALLARPAIAGYTVNVERVGGYYSGNGGDFTIAPKGGIEWVLSQYSSEACGIERNSFQTFCLEKGESVQLNQEYYASISDQAIKGGEDTGFDSISISTAYLYHEFQNGTLVDYDYDIEDDRRSNSAKVLQETIWC